MNLEVSVAIIAIAFVILVLFLILMLLSLRKVLEQTNKTLNDVRKHVIPQALRIVQDTQVVTNSIADKVQAIDSFIQGKYEEDPSDRIHDSFKKKH